MKKLFFSMLMLVGMGIAANAQVKINWEGSVDLDFTFKRCFVKSGSCIVDFVVTNNSLKGINAALWCKQTSLSTGVVAYDDEGNTYKNLSGTIGKEEFGDKAGDAKIEFPQEVSLKLRCQISEFDEFATIITLFKVPFYINGKVYYLQAKNIPVTRE